MKKLLILSFCAVILLSVVSGSIAFFTDSVSSSNVIVAGSIDITQYEHERKKNTDGSYVTEVQDDGSSITVLQAYTQDQTIHPCVQSNPTRGDVTIADPETTIQYTVNLYVSGMNNFVDKIVTVKNDGENHASVRTYVAVPATAEGVSWIHLDKNTQGGWAWHDMVSDENATEGAIEGATEGAAEDTAENLIEDTIIPGQEIDGKFYNIHVATYTLPLAPGAASAPSLLGFYLDSQFGSKDGSYRFTDETGKTHDLGSDPALSILVATEATQAIGYTGTEDALNKVFTSAYDALDTVFGSPVRDQHHPWKAAPPQESPSPTP